MDNLTILKIKPTLLHSKVSSGGDDDALTLKNDIHIRERLKTSAIPTRASMVTCSPRG